MALFVLDLIHPLVCRTLGGFFSCRDLASAGSWLAADFSVSCKDAENNYDSKYAFYIPIVAVCGVTYALGVPLLFVFLVKKFHVQGKHGDKVVKRALGWMYEPFREGKQGWLGFEMVRIVLLSSAIGFLAQRPSTFCRTLFQIERTALHSYGSDPHSC